jgi:hypothetical protein
MNGEIYGGLFFNMTDKKDRGFFHCRKLSEKPRVRSIIYTSPPMVQHNLRTGMKQECLIVKNATPYYICDAV